MLNNQLGTVIRILDEYTLVIDVGNSRVSVGDKVKVYQPLDDLFSPDGKKVATFDYTKDILEVIDTEENYSVCKKPTTKVQKSTFARLALSPMLETSETVYSKLNVAEESIASLPDHDSVIHIGDPVKKA